jgi:hypothetical protein
MNRLLTGLILLGSGLHVAAAEDPYRQVRCVAVGERGFSVSFESKRNGQGRVSLTTQKLSFGGNVKGETRLEKIRELRLSPVLQVVFVSPEHKPLKFGGLSRECRGIIRQAASGLLKVVDGEG